MCAAALFLDQLKKLFEAHKLLVSKKSQSPFRDFQNTVKRSLKGKLKYKRERSNVSCFKVSFKFPVVLTV